MIKLVNAKIERRYERDGSAILYNEALPRDLEAIWQRHTKQKGKRTGMEWSAAKADVLSRYVTGWEGIADSEGVAVPYSTDLLDALPAEVRNDLYNLITTGKCDDVPDEDEGAEGQCSLDP